MVFVQVLGSPPAYINVLKLAIITIFTNMIRGVALSNETVFLLNMKFILFTNQGYPLQNSPLGQLQTDGGVVSIVRSSAGRLLLVYLSARRLRSSGYYPKYQTGDLPSGF